MHRARVAGDMHVSNHVYLTDSELAETLACVAGGCWPSVKEIERLVADVHASRADLSVVRYQRDQMRAQLEAVKAQRDAARELLGEAKGHLIPYAGMFRDRIDAFLGSDEK